MTEVLDAAVEAARGAGGILKEYVSRETARDKRIRYKSEVDLVTEADLRSQEHIVAALKSAFPEHGILAEEGIAEHAGRRFVWIIDPLDGTTNFAHGYPVYAVSIGLVEQDVPVLGVVYDPNADELFVAERGGGATLNGASIRVSTIGDLKEALLVTGFPYWARQEPGRLFDNFRAFTMRAQAVRRPGSASIDLCSVACGRMDGFWEEGLKSWDTAAGSVILTEAGGRLSRFDGSPFDIDIPEILATNGLVHEAMMEVLASA